MVGFGQTVCGEPDRPFPFALVVQKAPFEIHRGSKRPRPAMAILGNASDDEVLQLKRENIISMKRRL